MKELFGSFVEIENLRKTIIEGFWITRKIIGLKEFKLFYLNFSKKCISFFWIDINQVF
jgi:hypothetical protein